jgi:hypothetical protein
MPLDRKDIEASLEKKGFTPVEGDHTFYVYWTTSGLKTSVFTKTSHGSSYKTLSDELVGKMARQCAMSTGQFKNFVKCTLSREAYEEILIETKRISL